MKIPHSGLVQKKQLMGLHVRDIHHLGYIVKGRAKRIPHTVQTLLLLPVGIFLFPYDGLHLILPALLPYQDSPHTHGPEYQDPEPPAGAVHLLLSILLCRCHGCIRQLEITLTEFKQRLRVFPLPNQHDLFLKLLPLVFHGCQQILVGLVIQTDEAVGPHTGGQFLHNPVQTRNKGVIRPPFQFFLYKALGGASDNTCIVDDPGISLEIVYGHQGQASQSHQGQEKNNGNQSFLHMYHPS